MKHQVRQRQLTQLQPNKALPPTAYSSAHFSLPHAKLAKACYADYRDVAEVAAIALTGDALSYGTFELCAPGMVNRVALVAIISAAIGHPIEAGESPFNERAQAAQIPDGLRDHLRVMYENYDQYGFPGGNAIVLRTMLGREPRSLPQYFQALVGSKVD